MDASPFGEWIVELNGTAALEERILATSDGMGWKGLQAVREENLGGEFSRVGRASTHMLSLSLRPPEKMDLRYEGVKRDMPAPAGSITVVPAGSSVLVGARRLPASAGGVLPRRKVRTVIEYIMENLEDSPTLEQMAAVVHLSPYHFARQFKAATGLPPHQYVLTRRVERAQHLLRANGELGLAEIALRVGFTDQSHFSFHFKRIVGVTPGRFRISARMRQRPQAPARTRKPSPG